MASEKSFLTNENFLFFWFKALAIDSEQYRDCLRKSVVKIARYWPSSFSCKEIINIMNRYELKRIRGKSKTIEQNNRTRPISRHLERASLVTE